jgi:hypothetical protein
MARWVTPDWSARPEGVPYATLWNPQTLNLYAYVGNNPVTRVDPDGHDPCKQEGGTNCGEGGVAATGNGGEMIDTNEIDFRYEQSEKEKAANEAATTLQVNVTYTTYDVHGANVGEALDNAKAGTSCGTAGCTTPSFAYTYDQKGSVAGSGGTNTASLTATNVTVTVNINVVTPNWVGYKSASASDQKAWDAATGQLAKHEEGHVAIDRAAAQEMKSAIQGTRATGSGKSSQEAVSSAKANLATQIKSKAQGVIGEMNGRNHAYDLGTCRGTC